MSDKLKIEKLSTKYLTITLRKRKWKSLSHVRLFVTPCIVHGILQARILDRVTFPFSRDLPNPGIKSMSPILQADSLPAEPQGKPKNTGVGSLYLLQGIFTTQKLNWGHLHFRWILYHLSHQGSPRILECVAYPFFTGSSQPRNWTGVPCIAGGFFTSRATREVHTAHDKSKYHLSTILQ